MPDYRQRLTELSKRTGASVEESDVERLGQTNADDVDRLWGALESQYERRGASDRGVELPDSSEYTAQGYGSGRDDTADDAPQNTRTSSVAPQASGARTSTAGNAYASYLGGGSQAPVSSTMPVQQQPDPMLARLVAQMEADRARQETERAEMRAMVMSQLGQATAPVDANSPGLKPIIDAQKLSLQRGAQRQRSAAAEQAGVRNLGDSGALNTRINQIEQGRGESEAGMIGQLLETEASMKLIPRPFHDVPHYDMQGVALMEPTPFHAGLKKAVEWYEEHGVGETFTHLDLEAK